LNLLVAMLILVLRHIYMVISEVVTLFFYVISIAFLPAYFGLLHLLIAEYHCLADAYSDLSFVVTLTFGWKVAVIVAISALPLYIIKLIKRKISPAASSKLL